MHKEKAYPTRILRKKRNVVFLLLLGAFVLSITCGKKAPPSPPIPIVPMPAAENRITQSGQSFLFAFKLPKISTDDKTPAEIGKIVIYRLKAPRTPPPSPQTQPVSPQTQPATQTQTSPTTTQTQQMQTQPAQTQTQPQTQTQTQTQAQTQSQPQTQTQTQTQTQPLPAETPRSLSAVEFEERAEKIAEISVDKIDSYMRDDYFIYQDKQEWKADSEDFQNWFYYGVKLYNIKNKENEFGRLTALFPELVPEAPKQLTVKVSEKTIELNWSPSLVDLAGKTLAAGSVSYNVYRGWHANFAPMNPINATPLTSPAYTDTRTPTGGVYYYFVKAFLTATKREQESAESNIVMISHQDTYPPTSPQELNVAAAREGMVLIWAPNEEEDVAGYNIYKKAEGETEYKKHNTKLVRETTYSDADVKPGIRYYYQVTAVDNAPVPNESSRSAEISEVQRTP